MELKYLLLLVLASAPLSAKDDKMSDTIERGDVVSFNKQLLPGFFMSAEGKKRYLELARKMTNRTYKEIDSYCWGDFVRFFKGTTKVGLGVLGAAAAYFYYRGDWDISRWNVVSEKHRDIVTQDLSEKTHKLGVYGVLGILSSSLLWNGLGDFSAIINKEERKIRNRDALALEGTIQRLAVCESPISENNETQ